jgi:hypothetical protein
VSGTEYSRFHIWWIKAVKRRACRRYGHTFVGRGDRCHVCEVDHSGSYPWEVEP